VNSHAIVVGTFLFLIPGLLFAQGPNVLINPGFESGGQGWPKAIFGGRSVVTTQFHSGSASLQILVSSLYDREVYQDVAITSGSTYAAAGWVRTSGIGGNGSKIELLWLNAAGLPDVLPPGSLLRTDTLGTLTGTQSWTRLAGSYVAPANAVVARFRLFTATDPDNSGTAWFDDTELILASSPDTTPPSTPTNLTATAVSSSQIDLSWSASTDNVGVTGYKVYRGGSQIATTTSTTYSDTGLTPSTTYTYTVTAYDAAGNTSTQSSPASATTQAPPPPDTTPPILSNVAASNITFNSAIISWTTDEPADSEVEYGLTTSYGNQTPLDTTLVASHSVTLTSLTASTLYHYRVKSKDAAGNPAVSGDFTFTTPAAPLPPGQGPGGPILVISSAQNPFSRYYAEILLAEGLNYFDVVDIDSVSSTLLANYDVTILAEMPLSSAQVTMLSDWVNAGGNLVAMRPDKQLAGLLGLTDAAATLANAYLLVDTISAPGAGIVNQTLQFHGTADLYTPSGASAVATLYSNATTPTNYLAAVTLRDVGSNGGQAAAFSYDLARSIVYTRQGNPAWAGQDRDGSKSQPTPWPTTAMDLFWGNASFDPQPNWFDLNKIAVPQADEQQRLLANLILQMNLDKKPLPRFWYFPRDEKAVIVMTGDDHAVGGTAGRFDQYITISPPNCSAVDWECVRSSSYLDYLYPPSLLTDAQVASYTAQGFEIGLHVYAGPCTDDYPSFAALDSSYATQLSTLSATYPSMPVPNSERTHCTTWSDYDSQPKVQLNHGIRLDTNYYYVFPSGGWGSIDPYPGFFTGSGMPMRFTDINGTLIDVYQAPTQMNDSGGQSYPFTVDTLLDRALGPEGYYGVFTVNMHTDYPNSAGSDAIVASALARGVPIISGRQLLQWLDGRNNSSFGPLSWNGGSINFTITAGPGANGLQAMIPTIASGGDTLNSITFNGNPVTTYTIRTIKGVDYAFVPALAGNYTATYAPDTTPPVISNVASSNITHNSATIAWSTNEPSGSQVEYGTTPSYGLQSPLDTALVTAHVANLTNLNADTLYHYRVKSSDQAGNPATSSDFIFTTLPTPDTTPPTVSITSPANGATVSGTINVSASASDNVGVVGVQFLRDGANLGAEDTVAPYSISWDTTTVANGSHTLSARATDAAGNQSTSSLILVTVSNAVSPQFARPANDGSNPGGWVVAYEASGALYQQIDEITPADSDLIRTRMNPINAETNINLSSVTDPNSSGGHMIRIRTWNPEALLGTIKTDLMQGSTVIASFTVTNPPTAYTTQTYTLTPTEANSIANYSALSLRFTGNRTGGGGGRFHITWAELEVPAVTSP
jgi:chitodextrinase